MTDHDVVHVTVLPDFLDQVARWIASYAGDGAYTGDAAYRLLKRRRQALPLPEVILPIHRAEVKYWSISYWRNIRQILEEPLDQYSNYSNR